MLRQFHSFSPTFLWMSKLLLCLFLALTEVVEAQSEKIAPDYIQQTNQQLSIDIERWLAQEFKQNYSDGRLAKFQVRSTLHKKDVWTDIAYAPHINIEKPWYEKFLNHFQSSQKAGFSTSNKTINHVKIDIAFQDPQNNSFFSNEIIFKLRKHIYLQLTSQQYLPQFISVEQQEKPWVVPSAPPPPPSILASINANFNANSSQLVAIAVLLGIIILLTLMTFFLFRAKAKKQQKREAEKQANEQQSSTITTDNPNDPLSSVHLKETHDAQTHHTHMTPNQDKEATQQHSENHVESHIESHPSLTPTENPNPPSPPSSPPPDTLINTAPNTIEAQQQIIDNLKHSMRTLLMSYTAKHPYFLRKLYELWQQSYDQQHNQQDSPYLGDKIAILYDIIGKKATQETFPILQKKYYIILEGQAKSLTDNPELWQEIYDSTKQDIIELEHYLNNPDPYQTPFGFIKAMPDSAIIALLNSKANHIQTIALAQFDPARCQSLSLHIEPDPKKHRKMMVQIAHYQQYDEYFFQDVADYLAYSFTQIVFKENTVPIDDLSNQYPKKQSITETQRALNDLQRQQNLGFVHLPKNLTLPEDDGNSTDNPQPMFSINPSSNNAGNTILSSATVQTPATETANSETSTLPQSQDSSVTTPVGVLSNNPPAPEITSLPKDTKDTDTPAFATPENFTHDPLENDWFDFGDHRSNK